MAGSAFDLTGSRLQDATRVNQAAEDADVTGWPKANDFIVCAMVETTAHGGASGTLQLRWRNVTDSGSFAALSGSGELTYSGTTDLVNSNAVASGEEVCTPVSGSTRVDGVEREGANDVSTTLAQNEYREHQWAIDASGGLDGKQYEFEIYDAMAGASLGTCLAQITTSPTDVNVNCTVVNLTLTEYPATVNAETNIQASIDALTLTTYPAAISLEGDINVNCSVANLTLSEYPATVNAETNIQAATDTLILTEQAAATNAETNVNAGIDALTLTTYGAAIDLASGTNVNASAINLTLAAYQAAVNTAKNIQANVAALTLTERQASVNAATNIQVGVDPLTLATLAADINLDVSIAASFDALMLTNYQASVTGTAAAVSPDGAAKVVAYAPPSITIVQGSRVPRIINDPRTPKIVKK